MGRSDFLRPRLRFVFLYLAVPLSSFGGSDTATSGSPRFLGGPRVHALLYDPGELLGRDLSGRVPTRCLRNIAFRTFEGVGLTIRRISGLSHTACTLAVYASQPRLPVCFFTATQDSLPAGDLSLAGRDFNPLGHFIRFLLL